jgi:hypothetical protein
MDTMMRDRPPHRKAIQPVLIVFAIAGKYGLRG